MRAKIHTLFWTRRQLSGLEGLYFDKYTLVQVVGRYVDIASYIRSFVYHSDAIDLWYVCELHTGLKFAQGDTRKEAIENAKERISKQGRAGVLRSILNVNRKIDKIPKPYKYREGATEPEDRSLEGWTDIILNGSKDGC